MFQFKPMMDKVTETMSAANPKAAMRELDEESVFDGPSHDITIFDIELMNMDEAPIHADN